MHGVWHWLAVIEPGLGRRDQQFFELAATLIPIFFLAGTIASAAQTLRPRASSGHVIFAILLLLFLIVEILAELISIQVLVSGTASDADRYLALGALILGMWVAGFALLWPWIQRFYVSRTFRQAAVAILVTVLLMLGFSAFGVFSVLNVVFEVTQEERDFQRKQKEDARRHAQREDIERIARSANELLRLNIRLARICRNGPDGGWTVDERLSLRLVRGELREYIRDHQLEGVVDLKAKGHPRGLAGNC